MKEKINKTAIGPVKKMYGAETWALKQTEMRKLREVS